MVFSFPFGTELIDTVGATAFGRAAADVVPVPDGDQSDSS